MSSLDFSFNEINVIVAALSEQIEALEQGISDGDITGFDLLSARAFLECSQTALRKCEQLLADRPSR